MQQSISKRQVSVEQIDDNSDGQRLDNYLICMLKSVPKSKVYQLIRTGQVRVNAKRAKPHTKLSLGDKVRVPPIFIAPTVEKQINHKAIDRLSQRILYEDDRIIVLNKPSGMAVHGGSGISLGLIEVLRQARPDHSFLELAHRLDKETSGCLMIAKSRKALVQIHEMLRVGKITKIYHALLAGKWQGPKKVVMPLTKHHLRSGERVVKIDLEGKPAETHFKKLKSLNGATLVEAKPITGRTHQIRVHAEFTGNSIAQDPKYGKKADNARFKEHGLDRLFLHAYSISIPFESQPLTIVCELDDNLNQVLNHLS